MSLSIFLAELMLKPVSLACGHSFCKYCLELWLGNRANCPSCRHAVPSASECELSVNVALQQVIAAFFPLQLAALESESQAERFAALRRAIHDALSSSNSDDLRDVLARLPAGTASGSNATTHASSRQHDQSLAVALILESDVELQERVLAAEIHERLRKERLLRESSRRRHTAAYNTTGLSSHVNPALLHMSNSTTTVRRNSNGSSNNSSNKSSNLLATFLSRKS